MFNYAYLQTRENVYMMCKKVEILYPTHLVPHTNLKSFWLLYNSIYNYLELLDLISNAFYEFRFIFFFFLIKAVFPLCVVYTFIKQETRVFRSYVHVYLWSNHFIKHMRKSCNLIFFNLKNCLSIHQCNNNKLWHPLKKYY